MKSYIFWYITPLLKAKRLFGGTYHLRLQGARLIQAGNQSGAGSKQVEATSCRETSGDISGKINLVFLW
jgi:hypothetical protein